MRCHPTWLGCRSQRRVLLADLCWWKVSARSVPPSPVCGEVSDLITKCKTPIGEWNPCPVEVSRQTLMASASPRYSLEPFCPKRVRANEIYFSCDCKNTLVKNPDFFFHHKLLYWVFNLTTCVAWVCVPVHRRWRVLTTCFARSVMLA